MSTPTYSTVVTDRLLELQQILAETGGKILRGWGHPRQSPARRYADIYPSGAYMTRSTHWIDHPYRVRLADGRTLFVSEPYDLDRDDLAEILDVCASDGWSLRLDGLGIHHPTTLRVVLTRP